MRASRWLAPVLWAGVIVALTSWPHPPELNAPSGTDKVFHSWMYAVLAFLSIRAAWPPRAGWRPWALVVAVMAGAMVFGAVDEWHQLFIPTRTADLLDWLADSAGAAIGVLAYRFSALGAKVHPEATQ